jgi:heme/copper-type cytochrome/quinol oxidase subunit 4
VNTFFYTNTLGWLASILLGAGIVMPYLLRRTVLSQWLGISRSDKPYLQRMWAHYWIGYVVAPLALVHAWIPMQAGGARGVNMAGLWIATVSLVLLFLQIVLGLGLKANASPDRRRNRRIHYWTMLGIVVTVAGHIWLNG